MRKIKKILILLLSITIIAITPIVSVAAHTHIYTDWEVYKEYTQPASPSSGKCFIQVSESLRVCTDCGYIATKTTKKSISHIIGLDGSCVECGFGTILRMPFLDTAGE